MGVAIEVGLIMVHGVARCHHFPVIEDVLTSSWGVLDESC